jgi:RNA polymerase sigma factor for flagellar operon FliA
MQSGFSGCWLVEEMRTIPVDFPVVDGTKHDVNKRNDVVLEYLPMVKFIATRIARRIPSHVEVDDLINAGTIGLIDAVDKFDSTRRIKFKTYAEFRIRGAILDELRGLDWMPRASRHKANKFKRAYAELEQRLGRPATSVEIAEFMNISIDECYDSLNNARGASLISMDELRRLFKDRSQRNVLKYPSDSKMFALVELMYFDEVYQIVVKAIEELPERERRVISLYYNERLSMREVGEIMHVSESRISQIHTRAITRLRLRLKHVVKR